MRSRRLLSAFMVGLAAFALYRSTLLPGVDFGDTGSLQATVGSPIITPRTAYPLYFAISRAFLLLTPNDPAYALNLGSAVEGAVACGILTLAGIELTGSIAAAVAAALLFAASYTFWSQAIIAEVYALHACFVALTLLLALRWPDRPTLTRLALFFACYALGFGNHLSMILLGPAYAVFLLVAAPGGWRSMLTPRIVGVAVLCAAAGALQYAGILRALWLTPQAPSSVAEGLQHFWFDVTKSDWRDTMVLNVPRSMLQEHAAMYWFDLRQQFGAAAVALALVGLAHLASADWRRALVIGLAFAGNFAFAYSYNVGDKHVFYLPSHLFVALLAGCGASAVRRFRPRLQWMAGALLVVYALARAWIDYPALDRSGDRRPSGVLEALTDGIDDQRAILIADLGWQVQNGLSYFAKNVRPEVTHAHMSDVLLYAPVLIADNQAAGRDVVLTRRARARLDAAYGPLLASAPFRPSAEPTQRDFAAGIAAGTRYAVAVLRPSRDFRLDVQDFGVAIARLAPDVSVPVGQKDYIAIAGIAGEKPALVAASDRPFTVMTAIEGVTVQLRMDSWLTVDTIRRMGFGHVIASRHHTMILERGVNIVTFDDQGSPLRSAYFAGMFAPEPRFVVNRHAMVDP